jgi:uncharacterized protein (TIGR02453 family)
MSWESGGRRKAFVFPPAALAFLGELRKHNQRRWFQPRKHIYEESVKTPMTEAVHRIGEALARFAPEMVADPKISLYRIYRDTRFSPDKSPYKTHAAAVFPFRGLPKNSGPGLYFHISPEEVLIGGGMYMPESEALRAVRAAIAATPREFIRIVESKRFRKAFGELEGEQLKTMPKGFSADHPAARYLRYKQFLFSRVHSPSLATSPRFFPTLLGGFKEGMPLIRFLAKAVPKGMISQNPVLR